MGEEKARSWLKIDYWLIVGPEFIAEILEKIPLKSDLNTPFHVKISFPTLKRPVVRRLDACEKKLNNCIVWDPEGHDGNSCRSDGEIRGMIDLYLEELYKRCRKDFPTFRFVKPLGYQSFKNRPAVLIIGNWQML